VELNLALSSSLVKDIIDRHPDVENSGYRVVLNEIAGEWRWGIELELVIADDVEDTFWQTFYRVQIGDAYYSSLDDTEIINFVQVYPEEIVTVKYKRKPYAAS
jgi:hypothetical protein